MPQRTWRRRGTCQTAQQWVGGWVDRGGGGKASTSFGSGVPFDGSGSAVDTQNNQRWLPLAVGGTLPYVRIPVMRTRDNVIVDRPVNGGNERVVLLQGRFQRSLGGVLIFDAVNQDAIVTRAYGHFCAVGIPSVA